MNLNINNPSFVDQNNNLTPMVDEENQPSNTAGFAGREVRAIPRSSTTAHLTVLMPDECLAFKSSSLSFPTPSPYNAGNSEPFPPAQFFNSNRTTPFSPISANQAAPMETSNFLEPTLVTRKRKRDQFENTLQTTVRQQKSKISQLTNELAQSKALVNQHTLINMSNIAIQQAQQQFIDDLQKENERLRLQTSNLKANYNDFNPYLFL